ncbi:MAG: ParB N-terminal domain-containing protein [Caulobacter sp.]|nr:ParB N-terminal domain-containing protein [Caulobacter sp.]
MAELALSVAAASTDLAVVEQAVMLPIDMIDDSDRLRPVDPNWAAALGRIMTEDGQDDPVSVCRLPGRSGWKLITGGHRLAGARAEGWTEIKAVVKSADALDRRRREVSENLWRKGLDPLDRAAFVAELHQVLRARAGIEADVNGRAISAQVRWQTALKAEAQDATEIISVAYGFAGQIGEMVGVTDRTIRSDLELYRRLSPTVAAQLRGHSVGRNAAQLRALTKLSEADQRRAADMILQGRVKNAGEAVALLVGKVPASADAKRLSAFLGAFERMGAAERRAALRTLAGLKLPKGVRLTFDGVADA